MCISTLKEIPNDERKKMKSCRKEWRGEVVEGGDQALGASLGATGCSEDDSTLFAALAAPAETDPIGTERCAGSDSHPPFSQT